MKDSKIKTDEQVEQTCLICGDIFSTRNELINSATLSDGSKVKAHNRCIEGLKLLLESVGFQPLETTKYFIRKMEGDWILVRHDFPNQYVPVLVFFSINEETPKSTQELTNWLFVNDLKLSNPSQIVKRLRKKGALGVIVSEDAVKRHFLTDEGKRLLFEYKEEIIKGGN